jgi:hypothetical protein
MRSATPDLESEWWVFVWITLAYADHPEEITDDWGNFIQEVFPSNQQSAKTAYWANDPALFMDKMIKNLPKYLDAIIPIVCSIREVMLTLFKEAELKIDATSGLFSNLPSVLSRADETISQFVKMMRLYIEPLKGIPTTSWTTHWPPPVPESDTEQDVEEARETERPTKIMKTEL